MSPSGYYGNAESKTTNVKQELLFLLHFVVWKKWLRTTADMKVQMQGSKMLLATRFLAVKRVKILTKNHDSWYKLVLLIQFMKVPIKPVDNKSTSAK